MESQKLAALMERHKKEQEEAVAAATAKLRAELQAPSPNIEEITARHAEELRGLESKLTAKHTQELEEAVEKTRREASGSQDKTDEQHRQDIVAATERGRLEMASKLKLKDNVLSKVQNNVKKLEWQIQELRKAGVTIPDPPASLTATTIKSTGAVPATSAPSSQPVGAGNAVPKSASLPAASTPAAKPLATGQPSSPRPIAASGSTAMSTGATSSPTQNAVLPRKPSLSVGPTGATVPAGRGGRGVVRGVVRGVARGGVVRGGAPGRVAVAQPQPSEVATDTQTPGMSIMGAAAKRAREETETPDSLAKRIKPAEGAAKPVALRRDRISTNAPNPPQ